MEPYESSNARRNAALVTLGIVLASEASGVVSGLGRLLVLQWISVRGNAAQDLAQASDASVTCSAFFQLAAVAACAIAFSMWFHRVYRNLPALGATGLDRTPAGAVGGFFIPIINLIRPYESMTEIWLHSQLPAADPLLVSGENPRSMKVWWASFLAAGVVGNFGGILVRNADTIGKLNWATALILLSDTLAIVAAASAMLLVRRVSAQQDALHRHLRSQRGSDGPVEAPAV